MESFKCNQG